MNSTGLNVKQQVSFSSKLLFVVSLFIVFAGLSNAIPGIPGLDASLKSLTGFDWFLIRKFPTEWFYPIMFSIMMLCVALKHSIWRSWLDKSVGRRRLGAVLDILLVLAALTISLTYVVEIESICLVDQLTGERERLLSQALKIEKELADLYGLPEPTTVEDPQCVGNTGGWIVLILAVCVLIFLAYNIKVWGFPLVAVALAIALYS
ncbi:MAG: C4-dicarboxylate ABC transporter, partial [Gammaproteobacteria bacterium]|nr:C4-dicarboxylate ABC transporter [Gammaproteobacteria bacterium]